MNDAMRGLLLVVGARFAFDGDLVEVMQIEGGRISVSDGRGRWRTLSLAVFVSKAVAAGQQTPLPALGTAMVALSAGQRQALNERGRHVREVLTGYRSGAPQTAVEGEPRPEYDPGRSMQSRQEAKAAELGVTDRTIRRWTRAYQQRQGLHTPRDLARQR